MPRAFNETERARIHTALLAAARQAAAQGGLRRVPVDDLCRSAGISKGAFYLFFPSKEALLRDLLIEAETTLRARIRAAATTGPIATRRMAVLQAIFEGVADHPLLTALTDPEEYAWLARSLPEGALEAARADDDAWSAELVAQLRAAGVVGEKVPSNIFSMIGATALALISQQHMIGAQRFPSVVALVQQGLCSQLE